MLFWYITGSYGQGIARLVAPVFETFAVEKISQNKLCQRLEEDKKSALAKRAESVRGRRRQKRWEEEIRKRTQRGAIYACKKQIVFQMG